MNKNKNKAPKTKELPANDLVGDIVGLIKRAKKSGVKVGCKCSRKKPLDGLIRK